MKISPWIEITLATVQISLSGYTIRLLTSANILTKGVELKSTCLQILVWHSCLEVFLKKCSEKCRRFIQKTSAM